mgnify:CR=1 FL=1
MFHLGFYLKEFFRHFRKNALWAGTYALTTFCLVLALSFQGVIQENVSRHIKVENKTSYFNALISARHNHSRVARKLRDLPGIRRVEEMSEKKIQAEVKELMGSIDLNVSSISKDLDLRYAGLKVILTQELKKESLELIRNYIHRLVGKDQVTLGPVVKPDLSGQRNTGVLKVFSKWGSWFLIAVLGGGWIFSGVALSLSLREHAYLLEQFQRRQRVACKVMAAGTLTLLGGSILFVVPFGPYSYFYFLPLIALGGFFSLLNLRSYHWEAS